MVREPSQAGRFYAAGAAALRADVDRLLGGDVAPVPALGLVVPHAGYVYSGRIAGLTWARATPPARVLLLGPNHTGLGARVALSGAQGWRTPLGEVARDEPLFEAVAALPGVEVDDRAHVREHSLEVQLPFLQRRAPAATMVALCLSHLPFSRCEQLGRELGRVAAQTGALLAASSDMSHHLPAAAAGRLDRQALERLLALDPAGLFEVVHRERITMCGVIPATVMLFAASEHGATRAELVRYGHSGETTGDDDSVVGYAGVLVV